jgi:hypothetical protein
MAPSSRFASSLKPSLAYLEYWINLPIDDSLDGSPNETRGASVSF